MTIKAKLFLGILLIIAGFVGLSFLGWHELLFTKKRLEVMTYAELHEVRASKAHQVADYFNTVRRDLRAFTKRRMAQDAVEAFEEAYKKIAVETLSAQKLTQIEADVKQHIHSSYFSSLKPYLKEKATAKELGAQEPRGILLQYEYIVKNPFPSESTEELEVSLSSLLPDYDSAHAQYHPQIRQFLEEFGYEDLYLIDTEGKVLYSVEKHLEFGTRVQEGTLASTPLAEAFKRAKNLREGQELPLEDYAFFIPARGEISAFAAAPIFTEGEAKKVLGVVALRLSLDKIRAIMSDLSGWDGSGLGLSGGAYLFGPDSTLRSTRREYREDPKAFLQQLHQQGVSPHDLAIMEEMDTLLTLKKVISPFAQEALRGVSGQNVYVDRSGEEFLVSYQPIPIEGLQWGVIAEVEKDAVVGSMREVMHNLLYWVCLVFLVIFAYMIYLMVSILRPIRRALKGVNRIAKGDLNISVATTGKGELAKLLNAIQRMAEQLSTLLKQVQDSSSKVQSTSDAIEAAATQQDHAFRSFRHTTEGVLQSTQGIARTATSLVVAAQDATAEVKEAAELASGGRQSLSIMEESMHAVMKATDAISSRFTVLNEKAERISGVVETITRVADKTNILSLNAAIEAEKAGEYGLGFSVVAAEIRRLADQTALASMDIETMIHEMQHSVSQGVDSVERFAKEVSIAVDDVRTISSHLGRVIELVQTMKPKFEAVSRDMHMQSEEAQRINQAMHTLEQAVLEATDLVHGFNRATQHLQEAAGHLEEEVARFTLRS